MIRDLATYFPVSPEDVAVIGAPRSLTVIRVEGLVPDLKRSRIRLIQLTFAFGLRGGDQGRCEVDPDDFSSDQFREARDAIAPDLVHFAINRQGEGGRPLTGWRELDYVDADKELEARGCPQHP